MRFSFGYKGQAGRRNLALMASAMKAFRSASAQRSPAAFFAGLQAAASPDQAIMGPQQYWLAFPDSAYRALNLHFMLTRGSSDSGDAFSKTLADISRNVVIMNQDLPAWFEVADDRIRGTGFKDQFWAYMHSRGAKRIHFTTDYENEVVEIYILEADAIP